MSETAPGAAARLRACAGRHHEHHAGDIRIVALCDGHAAVALERFVGIDAEAAAGLARAAGIDIDDVASSVICFAVEAGDRLHLIDAGTGDKRGPVMGHLPAAMKAAGLAPEAVDTLLMTHLHVDHAAGLYDGDRPAFPNATLRVSEAELAFWRDDAALDDRQRTQLPYVTAALAAYGGRTEPFAAGDAVAPGVTAVPLPGHTPGMTGFLIDGPAPLLIWGDVVHVPAFQVPRPEWSFVFDADPDTARETRLATLDRAATDGLLVAGAHLPFPGFMRVTRSGAGFDYSLVS